MKETKADQKQKKKERYNENRLLYKQRAQTTAKNILSLFGRKCIFRPRNDSIKIFFLFSVQRKKIMFIYIYSFFTRIRYKCPRPCHFQISLKINGFHFQRSIDDRAPEISIWTTTKFNYRWYWTWNRKKKKLFAMYEYKWNQTTNQPKKRKKIFAIYKLNLCLLSMGWHLTAVRLFLINWTSCRILGFFSTFSTTLNLWLFSASNFLCELDRTFEMFLCLDNK